MGGMKRLGCKDTGPARLDQKPGPSATNGKKLMFLVRPQRCQGKACQEWARGFKISGALVMGAQSNMSPQFLVSVASSCELGALFTVWKQG